MRGDARRVGAKGGQAKRNASRLSIEGVSVTITEMAERLGIGESAVTLRLKREQLREGPVTWAGLALVNRNRRNVE